MDSVTKGKEQVEAINQAFIAIDKEGASRLEETQEDLKTMQTFLSEMSTKFDSSASISNYNVASTRDMMSIKTIRDGVYKQEKIEELSSEEKRYLEMARTDYYNGEIDEITLETITKGLINGKADFLIDLINNKDTKELNSGDTKKVYEWGQNYREEFLTPKTILKEQQNIGFKKEKGGYETKEVWNINLKLNTYKLQQAHAIQADDNIALEKANKKEEELRTKYNDLSEHLISEEEPPQDLKEPLKLDNGEKLYYRVDSNGYLHYKAQKGYEYYEENHKQSKGGYTQGVVAKTATSVLATRGAGNLFTKLPQWAQKGSTYVGIPVGLGTELSGNSSWNPMYVPNPGEVKTMVYRTNEKTGEIENLIIDSQGNEVIKLRSWKEY